MSTIDGAPPIHETYDLLQLAVAVAALLAGVLGNLNWLFVGVGALFLGWLAIARSDYRRYAVYDVGCYQRLQSRHCTDTTAACADCGQPADGGEQMRRFTEWVVAGIVIARTDERARYYCNDHGGVKAVEDLGASTELELDFGEVVAEDVE